jgi:glucose uptake protein GlcU
MGLLERIGIVVLIAIIVGGIAYLMVGGIGAMVLSLFIFAFFVQNGFIPLWSVIVSLISGIFLLIGGKE